MPRVRKFEDFFCRKNNSVEKIDTLINCYEENGNTAYYNGYIFCPECYIANLAFVHHQRTPYLRTIPSSQHSAGCSYNYPYAKTETILEYIEKLSYEQVISRLGAMMRLLMPEENNSESLQENLTAENNPLLFNEEEDKKITRVIKKTIRRQRLSGWIDKSIAGKLHLFYGDVQISSEQLISKSKKTYFRWILRTKNRYGEWKYRTSLYRGIKSDEFDSDAIYKIVFIGTPSFETGYLNVQLENNDAVLYKKLLIK